MNCIFCDKPILSKDKRKKFCNSSCSASYNNAKFPRKIAKSIAICTKCGNKIELKKKNSGGYYNRKYCNSCLKLVKSLCGGTLSEFDLLVNQTKKSLYDRRSGWQSANSTIRKHSRLVFFASNEIKVCKICGYSNHIEVCHIKQVKEFTDDAKILEINDIGNLIALCPNHHWEFDNNLLTNYVYSS